MGKKNTFTDNSYKPVIEGKLEYIRGDGAKVTMQIQKGDEPVALTAKEKPETALTAEEKPENALTATQVEQVKEGFKEQKPEKPVRGIIDLFKERSVKATKPEPKGKPRVVQLDDNNDSETEVVTIGDVQEMDTKAPELNVVGELEGRGTLRTAAQKPATKPNPKAPMDPEKVWAHPAVGGSLTVFVLLYGDYHDMHKQCLDALVSTTPADRVEIRVGSNELCQETRDLIKEYQKQGRITLHYRHANNDRKYTVMREMFHDPENPITSKYLLWLDDDTMVNKDQEWLIKLLTQIINYHDEGYRYYGPKYIWKLSTRQQEWVRSATWYTGRPFKNARNVEVPNGDKVFFATGSFWAMEVEAMRKAEVPDPRIGHNGGDYMIGEQMHQLGYKLRAFSDKKSIVNWSSVPRRGLDEVHAGKA